MVELSRFRSSRSKSLWHNDRREPDERWREVARIAWSSASAEPHSSSSLPGHRISDTQFVPGRHDFPAVRVRGQTIRRRWRRRFAGMSEAEIMAHLVNGGIERLRLIHVGAYGIGFQIGVVQLPRVRSENPAIG